MIYDINTKNKSFLKISQFLRSKGVKNNKFMLALYDPSLVGVNPHDEDNLTVAQKTAIWKECSINKWYFLREVMRIPVDGALEGIPYRINVGNLAISYLRSLNINQIVILPRQTGKTIGYIADDVWSLNFVAENANVIYLNKEFKDSKKNLKQFKDMRLRLPRWLQQLVASRHDTDNQEKKVIERRNNSLEAKSSANDPDSADKLGRGLSTSSIVFDEFAFLKYNQIIYEACLPAWKQAATEAKNNGVPYGITIVTTPNNLDVEAGAYCKEIFVDQAARFLFSCFDMTEDELREYLTENSKNDYMYVEFNYKELGRTEEWFQQTLRDIGGNLAKLKREVLLEWPRSTDRSVFSEALLDKMYQFVREPRSNILVDNKYNISIYDKADDFDININYILSCDVAGGLSQDKSVINIIHPEDFRMVGDFTSNKIDTDNFKNLIEKLMKLYFTNSSIIIERNSYGLNIIQQLMKDPIIESRMYREDKIRKGEKTMSDGLTVKRKSKNVVYGFDTTSANRNQMFDMLMGIVEDEYDKIISPHLYESIRGLERTRTGRIEAGPGSYDDSVMAYLIFRHAVYYGSCFRDRFGIYPVASARNLRVVSGDNSHHKRMNIILERAMSEVPTTRSFNQAASYISDQESKIKTSYNDELTDEDRKRAAINRIINYNS